MKIDERLIPKRNRNTEKIHEALIPAWAKKPENLREGKMKELESDIVDLFNEWVVETIEKAQDEFNFQNSEDYDEQMNQAAEVEEFIYKAIFEYTKSYLQGAE